MIDCKSNFIHELNGSSFILWTFHSWGVKWNLSDFTERKKTWLWIFIPMVTFVKIYLYHHHHPSSYAIIPVINTPHYLDRESLDSADDDVSIHAAIPSVWHCFLHQLHCYLLPCLQSHCIHYYGKSLVGVVHGEMGASERDIDGKRKHDWVSKKASERVNERVSDWACVCMYVHMHEHVCVFVCVCLCVCSLVCMCICVCWHANLR